jgi:hypothetical protein
MKTTSRAPSLAVVTTLACAVAATLPAQTRSGPRGPRLVEITRAATDEAVAVMAPSQHGVAAARNGVLLVLVTRAKWAAPDRTGVATSDLELWRSDDRGTSWRRVATADTEGDADGAIVVDGEHLACAWTATNGKLANVYWRRYDLARERWLGEREQLTAATGEQDQYFATDLVRARGGALVVAIGSHRDPPAPWTCGWSTGMRWLRAGEQKWSPLEQVNVDPYGCAGNLAARGDVVDFTFRSNPRQAVHGVRSFDAQRGAFVDDAGPASPADPAENSFIANLALWCVDGTGGRTLLHVLGDHAPGRGRLAITYSRGDGPFRCVDLADDAPLHAGNENPTHFALARGPGNQVFAYFGKASEQFANLWQGVVEDGAVTLPPRVVHRGEAGDFAHLNGMRHADSYSGLHVVATSKRHAAGGGAVTAFGNWPATTVWTER